MKVRDLINSLSAYNPDWDLEILIGYEEPVEIISIYTITDPDFPEEREKVFIDIGDEDYDLADIDEDEDSYPPVGYC